MAEEREYGYITFSRKMFSDEDLFWSKRRVYSQAEAWMDLIVIAAFKPRCRSVGTTTVHLERGEVLASRGYLARRWNWGEKRVRSWLAVVVKNGRLRATQSTPCGPVYLLVNYERYNPQGPAKGQAGDAERASKGPAKGQQRASKGPEEKEVEERNTGKERKEIQGAARRRDAQIPDPPASIDTPPLRAALAEFADYRSKRRKPMSPRAWQLLFSHLAKDAGANSQLAVLYAISKFWLSWEAAWMEGKTWGEVAVLLGETAAVSVDAARPIGGAAPRLPRPSAAARERALGSDDSRREALRRVQERSLFIVGEEPAEGKAP